MEDPFFIVLKKALSKEFDFNKISHIIFLFSSEYNESTFKEAKAMIKKEKINLFLKKHKFDSAKNAVDFYFIKLKDGKNLICMLFNPYELFENEYILDIFENADIKLSDFEEAKSIYIA